MEKPGKKLENLIKLIQESLIDSPHTVIDLGYKIPNSSGREREIDILINSKINGMTIKIAIECKDHKRAVGAKEIEAFKGKCDRILDINKKVVVSKSGYQADAINAAKDFGIELYNIQDISHSTITGWYSSIIKLGLRFTIQTPFKIQLENNIKSFKFRDTLLHFADGGSIHILKFFDDFFLKNPSVLWRSSFEDFIERGCEEPEKKVNSEFAFEFKDVVVFVVDEQGVKANVTGIASSVDTWFEKSAMPIEEANSYVDSEGQVIANNIVVPTGKEGKTNLIITKDKTSIFYTDATGVSQELQHLATISPPKTK